jgi:UDP-glucose 4-epimerase
VIVASSSSVYGTGAALPASEDQPTRPASPYAASKLAAESYALAYARSFELPVLVFRLFNVYGPGQRADHAYAAVIPAFVAAACSGNALEIHGDGNQTRDFTYVGDTVRVIVEAVLHQVVSETPVNLAFGTRRSVLTVADELERVVGHPLSRRHVPARVGDVRDSQADPTRLRALFKAVEPTALEAGLKAAVEWSERIRGGSLFESADHQP